MLRHLALKNLASRPWQTILTASGIAIGITALTLMLSLSEGLKKAVLRDLNTNGAMTQLTVQEKPRDTVMSIFPIGERNLIDQTILNKIRQLEHVQAVYPEMIFTKVSSLEISWLNQKLQTDAMIFGVPYDFIADEYNGSRASWENSALPYPALISTKIMDIYNLTIASAIGLPTLSKNNLRSIDIKILPGQSTFFPSSSPSATAIPARITGFSSKTSLVGITVPLNAVRQMNTAYDPQYTDRFIRLYVQIDNAANIETVKSKIRQMGLDAISPLAEIQTISANMTILEIGLGMVGLIILIVAGLMIASTFLAAVRERKDEIGLFRALGATKSDIIKIFLYEAAILGLGGGATGILIAIITALSTNQLILNFIPALSFKPNSLFSYNPAMFMLILVFSVILSMLFAFIPAKLAAQLNPLEALTRE